jgi:hypothetical protein
VRRGTLFHRENLLAPANTTLTRVAAVDKADTRRRVSAGLGGCATLLRRERDGLPGQVPMWTCGRGDGSDRFDRFDRSVWSRLCAVADRVYGRSCSVARGSFLKTGPGEHPGPRMG